MGTFEVTGTVTDLKTLTSKQNKPYVQFTITNGESRFELSLFGNTMSFASKVVVGKSVAVKGMLTSREYNGKHYPNFQVQWIEPVKSEVGAVSASIPTTETFAGIDSIPF